jgi:hypothetical protein
MGAQAIRMRVAEARVESRSSGAITRPQNGWAVALEAEQQYSAGDTRAAIATSAAALQRTPLVVAAVRTIARARDRLEPTAGEGAWQLASTMGWRDRPTQGWALLRALANGEAEIFVMRADALMRTRDDDAQMPGILRRAMVKPDIRRALIARLDLNPEWRRKLFSADHPLECPELEGALAALDGLARSHRPPTRGELNGTILGLIDGGRFREAVALDRRFVRRSVDAGSLMDDGKFERDDYANDVDPFDWVIVRGAVLDDLSGRRTMVLIGTGKSPALVRKFIALAPGRYRLGFVMKGEAASSEAFGVVVGCAGRGAALAQSSKEALESGEFNARFVDFVIPASCELASLALTGLSPKAGGEAQFDDFSLTRIR